MMYEHQLRASDGRFNFKSNSKNFIIKEVHKDIAIQGLGNTGFNGAVTLSQPVYSVEEKPVESAGFTNGCNALFSLHP